MVNNDGLINYLKKNHYQSCFFGLGFIQIKATEEERYHFYHPELSAIVPDEEIHNHRYDFTSRVLKGCLKHTLYEVNLDVDGDGLWLGREVSCDLSKPAPEWTWEADVKELTSLSLISGSEYTLSKHAFHRVEKSEVPTVTFLRRTLPIEKEFAAVVAHKDSPEVCPFSKKMTDEELWDWIERISDE